MPEERVRVLVIGGGMVGLSAAAFLTHHDITPLVVERRETTSRQPKARGLHQRTLEIFRPLGLEKAIYDAGSQVGAKRGMISVDSLAGNEFFAFELPSDEESERLSPSYMSACDQERLEPLLLEHASEQGALIEMGTSCTRLEELPGEVRATLETIETGERRTVVADYVIAADGAGSGIRKQLEIGMHGYGSLTDSVSIVFRGDLSGPARERDFFLCYIDNDKISQGILVPTDEPDRWLLSTNFDSEKESLEDFRGDHGLELVRSAIGLPDIDVRIESVLSWEMAARYADRFQTPRIFLVGDAAHIVPPIGAFGGATGIQDAHNIAWKLAYALKGLAGQLLPASYEAERKPIGELATEQGRLRLAQRTGLGAENANQDEFVEDIPMNFGYYYAHSSAILSEENGITPGPGDAPVVHPDELKGAPGSRAPHTAIILDGEERSTIDLFGNGFVLLTGSQGSEWAESAERARADLGIKIAIYQVGKDVLESEPGSFESIYGLGPNGAALVRPDGFVGWRSKEGEKGHMSELDEVLCTILDR